MKLRNKKLFGNIFIRRVYIIPVPSSLRIITLLIIRIEGFDIYMR